MSDKRSTKLKGSIAEARIAELIMLYGAKNLTCYRPISDDEGIDLIVLDKKTLKTVFIQVKSRFTEKANEVYVSSVKSSEILNKNITFVVFCVFDMQKGDFEDKCWCVPGTELIRKLKPSNNRFSFVSGKKRESNLWESYRVDKKELADKLIEYMSQMR